MDAGEPAVRHQHHEVAGTMLADQRGDDGIHRLGRARGRAARHDVGHRGLLREIDDIHAAIGRDGVAVTFRQSYRSANLKVASTKTLVLAGKLALLACRTCLPELVII